jgi:hypothetical protein
MATQKTMESGPIDAVTGDAKYTLSEEKLLKKWSSSMDEDNDQDLKFEAKTLVSFTVYKSFSLLVFSSIFWQENRAIVMTLGYFCNTCRYHAKNTQLSDKDNMCDT